MTKQQQYNKEYYQKNKTKLNKSKKIWREKNKKYYKEYYKKNKKKIDKYKKKWLENHIIK